MPETGVLPYPDRVARLNASYAHTFLDSLFFLQRQTVAMWRTVLDSLDEAASRQRTTLVELHPQRDPVRRQSAERVREERRNRVMTNNPLSEARITTTADQAEAFLNRVQRLTEFWIEGILSDEEFFAARARLTALDDRVAPLFHRDELIIPRD